MMQVDCSALPNGIRVVSAAIPRIESVSVGIWASVGSRHESLETSGASHFIEHLLFKGTRTRSARDISMEIEGRGGYLDAFTQEESTCYYARMAREHMGGALDVLADMILRPCLDPEEVDKERSVIVEEILMYRDQPQHVVHEKLTAALWPNHALGRSVAGTPESLGAMTRASLRRFKEDHYVPGNLVVAFAGGADHESCVATAAQHLGGMRGRRAPAVRYDGAATQRRPLVHESKDVEQTHLAVGFRHFGRLDRRRHALRVFNTILGENMSSRLFQVLREQHGLAYSVQSSFQTFHETGALLISAGLDGGKTLRAVDLMTRELKRLKDRPVGPGELRRAKDYLIGQMKLGLESAANQMMWIGEHLMAFGRVISPEDAITDLMKVTSAEVQALAREILSARRASISLVSPETGASQATAIRTRLAGL
jgi:predicted Zn-dependent peptidase